MSAHRPRRIDRGAAERMLRGGPVNAGAGADPLADLLAAAAVPARDRELDGEEAAVAAFREARLAHVTQPRRKPVIKMLLTRLLTVKIAAIAAGATVISGAAVAASTGVLPGVGGGGSAAVSPTASAADPSIDVPQAAASVSASVLALCHSYTAAAATDAGAALDSPNMSALVSAAGGTDQVGPFCVKALRGEGDDTATPGADAGANAGPDGAGAGAAVSPGASVSVNTDPTGTGVGAQVPGAGVGASAGPQGAGVGAAPGAGANAGANAGASGAGAATGAGVGAGASVHR